jgi:sugar lactone lactonase YvrE
MDETRFDHLARRVSELMLPRVPRRGVLSVLGGVALTGAFGSTARGQDVTAAKSCKDKGEGCDKKKCDKDGGKCCCKDLKCDNGKCATKKKCKNEGQSCDKKKCDKDGEKCCCNGLECKNDTCKGSGSSCPTDATFDFDWDSFSSDTGPDEFRNPFGITTDPDGNVLVTDTDNFRVLAFNQNGSLLSGGEFGSEGNGDDEFRQPLGLGLNENSSDKLRLTVVDPIITDNDRRIRLFVGDVTSSSFGNPKAELGDDTGDNNISPVGVAVDAKNRIWVTDAESPGKVFLFDRDASFTASFSPTFTPDTGGDDQLNQPQGIAVVKDADGNFFVYVADTLNNRIVKFQYVSNDSSSGLEHVKDIGKSDGETGNDNGQFNRPTGLTADACGNLWVADRFNNRLQVFDPKLKFLAKLNDFDNGDQFNEPTGVALNPDGDELYVVDSSNDRVVAFTLE